MKRHDISVIGEEFIVLNCIIGKNNITIVTERCPFCGEHHFHETRGTDWIERVCVINGIRTLHHRCAPCANKELKITLADGEVACNNKGYFLGIGNAVPW